MVKRTQQQPKVSILMPVYNAERFVEQAVESILHQTFTDFEFIIIDDGSTDRTPEILKHCTDPRIHLITNEGNQGITAALNRGLALARGEYIARMDADDISLPHRLEKQVAYLDAHPQVGVIAGNVIFINEQGQPINNGQPAHKNALDADYLRWALNWQNPLIHPTVLMRKRVLDESGLNYADDLHAAEDYSLWLKLIEKTDIAALEPVQLHYRILPTSINRTHHAQQLEVLRQVVQTRMRALFGEGIATPTATETLHAVINQQKSETKDHRGAADLLLKTARHYISQSNHSAAQRILQEANRYFRQMAADAATNQEAALYVLSRQAQLIFGEGFASMGYDAAGQPDDAQTPLDKTHFQVMNQVPRFVEMENYADAFGKQWNTYRKTQLDSYTGVPLSRGRLEGAVGGSLEKIFQGKTVLEAGCGAGRFTEVMLEAGARVFAMDLSNAVEANYENCQQHPHYFVCQANLFEVPVRPAQFDVVVCFGVLQATPNPEQALEALVKHIKPGGYLVVDIYPPNYPMTLSRRLLRAYLVNKAPEYTIKTTERIRDALWPAHRFLWNQKDHPLLGPAVRRLRPHFVRFSPLVDYHESYLALGPDLLKQWAGLDMHDTVTDYYKHLRSVDDIKATLKNLNMLDVMTKIGGNGVESLSRKPEQADDPALLLQQATPSAIHPTLSFDEDPYPGRPKILFIGPAESSHTRGTIDLLDEAGFNVRLFATPNPYGYVPPAQWKKRTYITNQNMPEMSPGFDPITRRQLYPSLPGRLPNLPERIIKRLRRSVEYRLKINQTLPPEAWLAKVIRDWQPDVIETLGIHPGGAFYLKARDAYKLQGLGKWSLTIRGTPDYELDRHHPARAEEVHQVIRAADQILSDNEICLQDALEMGAKPEQIAPVRVIPGAGGLHIDPILKLWQGKPSQRRVIVMPKAYESPISVVLPVFEALQLCWEQIQPVEIYMLSIFESTANKWFWALPEAIRAHCHPIEERIPHHELLLLLSKARVMLAPSLLDGTPNVALEAMAAGALPILSPLRSLTPLFEAEKNVIYARNLYPQEIAEALVRAMTDDRLVDEIAQNNIVLARQMAERDLYAGRYAAYYEALAQKTSRKQ